MTGMIIKSTTTTLPNPKDTKNITNRQYKNFSPEKLYFCSCSLCDRVLPWIIQQYQDFKDILIVDSSPEIYDVFSEPVIK
jgi:hypothetical protein